MKIDDSSPNFDDDASSAGEDEGTLVDNEMMISEGGGPWPGGTNRSTTPKGSTRFLTSALYTKSSTTSTADGQAVVVRGSSQLATEIQNAKALLSDIVGKSETCLSGGLEVAETMDSSFSEEEWDNISNYGEQIKNLPVLVDSCGKPGTQGMEVGSVAHVRGAPDDVPHEKRFLGELRDGVALMSRKSEKGGTEKTPVNQVQRQDGPTLSYHVTRKAGTHPELGEDCLRAMSVSEVEASSSNPTGAAEAGTTEFFQVAGTATMNPLVSDKTQISSMEVVFEKNAQQWFSNKTGSELDQTAVKVEIGSLECAGNHPKLENGTKHIDREETLESAFASRESSPKAPLRSCNKSFPDNALDITIPQSQSQDNIAVEALGQVSRVDSEHALLDSSLIAQQESSTSSSRDVDSSRFKGCPAKPKTLVSDKEEEKSYSDWSDSSSELSEDDQEHTLRFPVQAQFDMKRLQDCLNNGAAALDQVVDKNVVLVLGKTGAGKSTFIQGIAGKQITESIVNTTNTGEAVAKKVFVAQDEIPGFEIGHAKKSMTRFLHCFVPETDRGVKAECVFIDSPGFEDTDGPEVDVATSVMINQVVKRCESLRFVFLINYASLLEDRGGSMRSVLKIIKMFVDDFGAHKGSFMFLFTHSNEIKEVPEDLPGARECLLKELIRTGEGTSKTDSDVLQIIGHMIKCLKKRQKDGNKRRYQSVDILHPVKSDFAYLKTTLEEMKPVTKKIIAGNCGLSPQLHMRFSAGLETLSYRMKLLLSDPSFNNAKEAKLIGDLLVFFQHYIDIEVVRRKAAEWEYLMEKNTKSMWITIEEETLRGTSVDYKFGRSNVDAVKNAISQLETFNAYIGSKENAQECASHVMGKVRAFQKNAMNHDGFECGKVHIVLGNLCAWSEGFGELAILYEEMRNHIESLLQRTCEYVAGFDLKQLSTASLQSMTVFVEKLRDLELMCGASGDLLEHSISTSISQKTLDETRKRMINTVESLGFSQVSSCTDLETLAEFGDVARALQRFQNVVNTRLLFPQFDEVCSQGLNAMARWAADYFSNIFLVTKKNSPTFDASWRNCLMDLSGRLSLIDGLHGDVWEHIRVEYVSTIHQIKAVLDDRVKMLESNAEKTHRHGFMQGADERNALAHVKSCQWLDELVDPENQSTSLSLSRIVKLYHERIDIVFKEVDRHTSILVDNVNLSVSSQFIHCLRSVLLPELHQITLFDNSLLCKQTDALAPLLEYIKHQKQLALELLRKWEDAAKQWSVEISKTTCRNIDPRFHQELCESWRAIDSILGQIEMMVKIHPLCEADNSDKTIQATIQGCFQGFIDKNVSVVECRGRYFAKNLFLSMVDELASSAHISIKLLDGMKQKAKESVQKHAEMIQRMMSSGDVDMMKVKTELEKFQKASLIDRFISNEGSSRYQSICQLRTEKEVGVEAKLQDLIHAEDFHGVIDLLEPYVISKDRPSQLVRLLCLALLDKVDKAVIELSTHYMDRETLHSIASSIEILELAEKKLKKLTIGHGLYLPRDLHKLKAKANEVLCGKIQGMRIAAKRSDFVGLGTGKLMLCAFAESPIQRYLAEKTRKDLESALILHDQSVKSVSQHLETFMASCLTEGAVFLGDLVSLKLAHDSDSPMLEELADHYEANRRELVKRLNERYRTISAAVDERQCFDEAIAWMHSLHRQMNQGLSDHISHNDLAFDCIAQLESWRSMKSKYDKDLDFDGIDAEAKLNIWARSLDNLHPKAKWWIPGFLKGGNDSSYKRLCKTLEERTDRTFNTGKVALQKTKDLILAQESIALLELVSAKVGHHIVIAAERRDTLRALAVDAFLRLCNEAREVLEAGGIIQFQRLFPDYRGFTVHVPCTILSDAGKTAFSSTNQLIFQILDREVTHLKSLVDCFDFRKIKETIEHLRISGSFVADRLTLLHEECSHYGDVDRWLGKIQQLCITHFSGGRRLDLIKHFAALGLTPSAAESEIRDTYTSMNERAKANIAATPQNQEHLRGSLRAADLAFNELMKAIASTDRVRAQPFESMLRRIDDNLREKVRVCLQEQKYNLVEQLLFKLDGLRLLDPLVNPPLESSETCDAIISLVKNHADGVRVDVNTNWSERKYKALNDNISDLKQMEASFKSYPDIFPTSWNTGILGVIESEIEVLGVRARGYLESKATAYQKFDDFRRCFVRMGFIFDELACFRGCTKSTMCSVLECCLNAEWGHGFLFELGLSLQRGDENAETEENRISQMIVAEFSHFKEVQTMVWNEETCQKPADDTVQDIRGEKRINTTMEKLDIDKDGLLQSFWEFEARYKTFLAEYLSQPDDIQSLVQQTINTANKLKPVDCTRGWGADVKGAFPNLVAGVFAVFTVLKSAASYSRLENEELAEKILMKPHNIQVLTILCMLGCGDPASMTLPSQVMQIRTGEGKSLIIGAMAVILALLGFRVRCICYSEYLSNRDYELFRDLFGYFQLIDIIKYSKITTLSEEKARSKGDLRALTESLLNGQLESWKNLEHCSDEGMDQEIWVVDEFDVFFGSEFYGQTYNQVVQLRDPEVGDILRHIWSNSKRAGHRLKLSDIKGTEPYQALVRKYHDYEFLLDNEISLMIDQVKRFDNVPYHLDEATDRIGYQAMDSIEYNVTYGYCTMFAYLNEADKGCLKNRETTLANVLIMPVSCGQFSYANISPLKILGVSGTVEAMGQYEQNVLQKYGIERFVYVPSVYGPSNFQFDSAGEGIFIETTISDFFHKIASIILEVTKNKRAVIVFFRDVMCLCAFKASSFYKKLGRDVRLLTEDMNAEEKSFVVKKAATAGQVTLCTAPFGRGTDFFCKDDVVQKNGGVHIVQAFLSEELSEELQIKGRTARQGKKGSYQMVLLEHELETYYGLEVGAKDKIAREDLHSWLSSAREKKHQMRCHVMEANLEDATKKDAKSHELLHALLTNNVGNAQELFKELYFMVKTQSLAVSTHIDLAFLIDITGSMGPYTSAISSTVRTLVDKQGAVMGRLRANYPDTEFTFHVAVMGFRDIDDTDSQFIETLWRTKSHFTEDVDEAIRFVETITKSTSGGADIAEDVLGAIDRCCNWNVEGDWSSRLKFVMVLTDAPAHGFVDPMTARVLNADYYDTSHPKGLTSDSVIDGLVSKGIDLFLCSFNPASTSRTEQELSQKYRDHPGNKDYREVTLIPLVPYDQRPGALDSEVSYNRHIVFVLDESGSMSHNWPGVVAAYNQYIGRRRQYQCDTDLVSVVQFSHEANVCVDKCSIRSAPTQLYYHDGGTQFGPAAASACQVARGTPSTHVPVIVFMSDGEANDAASAASHFLALNNEIKGRAGSDLELHVIAFGSNANRSQLAQIAQSSPIGKIRSSLHTTDLSKVFEEIAGGANVASLLEAEIGKRVSEAVGNKLALEFM